MNVRAFGFIAAALLPLQAGVALAAPATEGSLIDPDQYRGIAADRRAYRVGDTLTVLVVESARANSRAGTDSAKRSRVRGQATDGTNALDLGFTLAGDATGSGQTSRYGDLRAQLSVRVVAIEPNGQLRVRGDQAIRINGETQTIAIKGLVRIDDIGHDNTVISNRLSDAEIEFTGRGVVSASQRQSLAYRILNFLRLI